MELRDALDQISAIRQHMASTEVFRGYRSWTAAFTGLLAIAGAAAQHFLIPDPARDVPRYIGLWFGAAVVGLVVVAAEMSFRYRRSIDTVQRQATLLAVEQFLPSLVAGGLLTFVMFHFAADALWLLPALWAMLFSQGIFASRRLLPRGIVYVAGYYLVGSLLCVAVFGGPRALSPWAMGATFGAGQLLAAGVLYWNLERDHA